MHDHRIDILDIQLFAETKFQLDGGEEKSFNKIFYFVMSTTNVTWGGGGGFFLFHFAIFRVGIGGRKGGMYGRELENT